MIGNPDCTPTTLFSSATVAASIILTWALATSASAAEIMVPVKFDYPLLRHLLVQQLFTGTNDSREILNDPTACSRIELREPQISPQQDKLRIVARVSARLGVAIFNGCQELLDWQGKVGFIGRPVIQPGGTSLRFQSEKTWLVGSDGGKLTSGALWDAADAKLQALFSSFILDLSPHIAALVPLLPEVLPQRSSRQLQRIVSSLKLHNIEITEHNLNAVLGLTVAELTDAPEAEAALTEAELAQWEQRWQMMDALLVLAVKHYASATHLQDLRAALLDILIESRYRLRDALEQPANHADDPVRNWFLDSWQSLAPVVRRIALEQSGQEYLLWFNVLTATDALYALDQLGPGIGLEISSAGLRRLARLINEGKGNDVLRYDEALDPELQQLFLQRFEPEAAAPAALPPAPLRLSFSFFSRALAVTPASELNTRAPSRADLGDYLPKIAILLADTAEQTLAKHQLGPEHSALYKKLVLATAWQESCWRQYVVKNQRLEPLRSGTGDVGLMQINERVWRGFYDLQKLRWDIHYNARAGAQVLLDYLVKYAIKRGEQQQPGGLANLARASYSAYNGGPSQVSRYRSNQVAPRHRKVDAAFWDKYRQVDVGNELNVAQCLGGELKPGTRAKTKSTQAGSTTGKPPSTANIAAAAPPYPAGERAWLLAQDRGHFTLQLGAFSERQSAANFITQQALSAPVYVHSLTRAGAVQYLVLYGSYSTRDAAQPAQKRFSNFKPWLRQFKDLL